MGKAMKALVNMINRASVDKVPVRMWASMM